MASRICISMVSNLQFSDWLMKWRPPTKTICAGLGHEKLRRLVNHFPFVSLLTAQLFLCLGDPLILILQSGIILIVKT